MKTDEMVTILERIARDEDKSPTARCTAIRTLRQIEQDRAGGRSDELDDELERLLYDVAHRKSATPISANANATRRSRSSGLTGRSNRSSA